MKDLSYLCKRFFIHLYMGKKVTIDQFSSYLFWDADPDDLDIDKHKAYVVDRVLECGQWEDWLLVRNYYGLETIKEIALNIRGMYPENLSFIALMTHIPENQFRCYELLQSPNRPWYF